MFKITIKLINISQEDWKVYFEKLIKDHKINFIQSKDTFIFFGNESVITDIWSIKEKLEENDKKIILNLLSV